MFCGCKIALEIVKLLSKIGLFSININSIIRNSKNQINLTIIYIICKFRQVVCNLCVFYFITNFSHFNIKIIDI